jgi:hypothetical protein
MIASPCQRLTLAGQVQHDKADISPARLLNARRRIATLD